MKLSRAIALGLLVGIILGINYGVIHNINTQLTEIGKEVFITRTDLTNLQDQETLNTKAIGFLFDNLEELREDGRINIEKMLHGSVFVKGLFGLGSGTVVKKTIDNMYILTCYHVVAELIAMKEAGLNISATVGYVKDDRTGTEQGIVVYAADIIKADKDNDLCLLKTYLVDDYVNVIKIASEFPKQGDIVYSVGNPLGVMRTISRGILSNHKEGFYLSDNTTTYGNSGGTLYNAKSELIGIPSNVMGYQAGEGTFVPESGLGMSIDLLRVKTFLEGEL